MMCCAVASQLAAPIFNSQLASLNPAGFSILNSQFSILNSQFSILNSQFSIFNSQFSIPFQPFLKLLHQNVQLRFAGATQ